MTNALADEVFGSLKPKADAQSAKSQGTSLPPQQSAAKEPPTRAGIVAAAKARETCSIVFIFISVHTCNTFSIAGTSSAAIGFFGFLSLRVLLHVVELY